MFHLNFFSLVFTKFPHLNKIVVEVHPPDVENRAKLKIIPPTAQQRSAPLYVASVVVLYRCSYSDDVGRHDQRNVNKNKAFKIKLAVTMTSPVERKNLS